MRKKSLYPRLAGQNIIKNRRFFVPYGLTVLGTSAAFYIMSALVFDPGAKELRGYQYVQSMMVLGMFIAGLFTAAILFYTNSFLMKQRRRELGLCLRFLQLPAVGQTQLDQSVKGGLGPFRRPLKHLGGIARLEFAVLPEEMEVEQGAIPAGRGQQTVGGVGGERQNSAGIEQFTSQVQRPPFRSQMPAERGDEILSTNIIPCSSRLWYTVLLQLGTLGLDLRAL